MEASGKTIATEGFLARRRFKRVGKGYMEKDVKMQHKKQDMIVE